MFHRFSAAPAKARSQSKGPGSARASNKNKKKIIGTDSDPGAEQTVHPLAKRQKAARACQRCRLHRIKCDEQKPCAQCVSIKAKCIVSYSPPRSSKTNNDDNNHPGDVSSSVIPPRSSSPPPLHIACRDNSASTSSSTPSTNQNSPYVPASRLSTSQDSSWATRTPPDNVSKECFNLAHIQGFFASGQSVVAHTPALGGCVFPQLPHPTVPSGERPLASNVLLKNQWSYYLRLFWDDCHPLLQIISKAEFAELDALPPPTMFDQYSARTALVDSMIALGMQHSRATGLDGRILGLQQQSAHAAPSPKAIWPGFEYFHRCRECMRTNTDVTLEVLRCHALMVLYLIKGNAFHDAYNLLGITVRKAYIAKLHRPPPSHLPEIEKTARMQLWWMVFSLDLQCSLQLGMPPACQKSLVKCPFPAEDALARYCASRSYGEGTKAYTYSTLFVNLALIVTDIGACVSTADLVDDDGNSPATLEGHARNLTSALQDLEVWRNRLPPELLLCECRNGSGDTETLDFNRVLALPGWLRRQAVLLELYYHNAHTLIQRPFIRLRYARSDDAIGITSPHSSQQPHVERHIASALYHATMTVDTVFAVCSMSDILYGWSDVLQSLWNATLTITASVSVSSLISVGPKALDSLTRAQAVFELFSSTCPSATSAKGIVQSLAHSLQNMMSQGSCAVTNDDQMGWDLFTSLLEEQQTSSVGPESGPSSNDLYGSMLFSPFMPSASQINTPDLNSVTMQFGDS
ncbi:hypothetical protein N7468_010441 [Penicillium chermesinum]|uniref:Zn(2)-C6 fungal-type domain-containing protein n=1 Tax=Penicillium chermesinum TaxID=63820 RepID=A0A9W9NEM6_9EURO|nr:uncharacterized protein N7468_010441 [Penicillium chermesinum]KAJ5217433.1 hypothetical protein N7468_010441 [Penicillium chermesinum]KAJ6170955.1 hypothetical protein N7470_000022 [Penicillium chermesinum]